jgi:hypothetical protein
MTVATHRLPIILEAWCRLMFTHSRISSSIQKSASETMQSFKTNPANARQVLWKSSIFKLVIGKQLWYRSNIPMQGPLSSGYVVRASSGRRPRAVICTSTLPLGRRRIAAGKSKRPLPIPPAPKPTLRPRTPLLSPPW